MSEKAERPESIRDRHDDDASLRQLVAPVQRHRRRSVRVAAAVNPDHDGQAFVAALAGVQMFRYRQSSLVAGGFSPGMETPFCMHAGANEVALRVPFHGATGCGSRQRSSPRGGAANGTPL